MEVKIDIAVDRHGRKDLVIPLLHFEPALLKGEKVAGLGGTHLKCQPNQFLIHNAAGIDGSLHILAPEKDQIGIKRGDKVGCHEIHVKPALSLVAVIIRKQLVELHIFYLKAGPDLRKRLLIHGDKRIRRGIVLTAGKVQGKGHQLPIHQLAAQRILFSAVSFAIFVERPSILIQEAVGFA